MTRRPTLVIRSCAFVVLFVPSAGAAMSACGSNGAVGLPPEAGESDVTIDGDIEGGDEGSGPDATSCAVDAGPIDPTQAAAGQQLVLAHKCESCHGSALSGNFDGVPSLTAIGGTAYPPNLTSDPATGLGCWTNAQIENAMLNGIDNHGMQLCSPMPLFGHISGGLTTDQAATIVQYLRSIAIVSNQVPATPACPVPEAGPPPMNDGGLPPPPVDAAIDARPPMDAGRDAHADSGSGLEAGPDAGVDSGPGMPEAGPDAPPDADIDSTVGDDGGPEAAVEASTDGNVSDGPDEAGD